MSGTGTNTAPARLTFPAGDQPIGAGTDGTQVMPSMYFVQFLQRLMSYIGQPVSGTAGVTLSRQVADAAAAAQLALTEINSLQTIALSLQATLQTSSQQALLPAAPNPCLTQAQVLARQTFVGSRW